MMSHPTIFLRNQLIVTLITATAMVIVAAVPNSISATNKPNYLFMAIPAALWYVV